MSLSVSGYMNQFYQGNLFGATKNGRTGQLASSLAMADIKAVRRAVSGLGDYDYDDSESDGEELISKVEAFVSTYNNYMDSAKGVEDKDADRYLSQLKKLTKKYEDELKDIGITIQSSGKLAVDEDALNKAGRYYVKKVLSADGEFSQKIGKQMKLTYNMYMRNSLNIPKQSVQSAEEIPGQDPSEGDSGSSDNSSVPKEDTELAQQLAKILAGSTVDYAV